MWIAWSAVHFTYVEAIVARGEPATGCWNDAIGCGIEPGDGGTDLRRRAHRVQRRLCLVGIDPRGAVVAADHRRVEGDADARARPGEPPHALAVVERERSQVDEVGDAVRDAMRPSPSHG